MIPLAAPLVAKAIGFFTAPKTLVAILVIGVALSGWALAWGRGKRIESLRATVAAEQAKAAEYQSAYEHLAVVVTECARAGQALEAATRNAHREALQAVAKAQAAAQTYKQQAEALRAAVAPPERSCEAADRLVVETLR